MTSAAGNPLVRCPWPGCWVFQMSRADLVGHVYQQHNTVLVVAQALADDAFAGRPPRLLPIGGGQLVNVGAR